jgi:tryptophan 7-halogenase
VDLANGVQKIIIVGGGTAGWMAALALAHYLRRTPTRIVLVESSAISTVGVGEATLPSLRGFHATLGIDEQEFVRATRATFKLGIQFQNWNGDGGAFFHPFSGFGTRLGPAPFFHYWSRAYREGKAEPLDRYSYSVELSRRGAFAQPAAGLKPPFADFAYAFHFDAGLYATYLKGKAQALGVETLDAKVVDISIRADDGFVESIHLEGGETLTGELFIDCSGFRALLIEGGLKTGFDDWSHWLPVDRAVALPSPKIAEPDPFTTATALEAGWSWRIPLQHRTGNGYVYCSDFASDDEAVDSLVRRLGGPSHAEPNLIRFKTGRRRKLWNKNCVGLGLASGFIEPLESTSIALIQSGISKLLTYFPTRGFDPALEFEANDAYAQEVERIRDFIILHYKLNGNNSGQLWHYCREMTVPASLERKLQMFKRYGHLVTLPHESFEPASWLALYAGFGIMPEHIDLRACDIEVGAIEDALAGIRSDIVQSAARTMSLAQYLQYHRMSAEMA